MDGAACGGCHPPPGCCTNEPHPPVCTSEPASSQDESSERDDHRVSFPCAAAEHKANNGHPAEEKKKKSSSKLFIPSYLHTKEIMARVMAHDYGRQWLAERDAWFGLHATSDDHLRERMLERCRETETRYVTDQRCCRDLKENIARGRLAGSKNKYKHIQGALNTHWNPYPPVKGWRC